MAGVFSGSRHGESFRPNPQTRVAPFNASRNPCLRDLKLSRSLSSRSHSGKKGSFSLQNDALIAILIVKRREVVISKARDELCRVAGSEKIRIRKFMRKKAKKKKWFLVCNLPFLFGPNPETGVSPFYNRSNPCFRVWPEMHWILSSRSGGKF